MRPSWPSLIAAAAVCTSLVDVALGNSHSRGPLDRLGLVETPKIHTAGRRVHAHTTFDVSFDIDHVPNRLKFKLEPNHDVIPHGATVQYLDEDGEVVRTEAIDRKDHRVYKGTTWMQNDEEDWSQVGWARVSVHQDGDEPIFEGAFTLDHHHYHIQLGSFYKNTMHPDDAALDFNEYNSMVVFRDTDISKKIPLHRELKRDMIPVNQRTCNSHQLSFNSDPNHPIRNPAKRSMSPSYGSMSLSAILGKRQSIDGGGSLGGGNSAGVHLKDSIGNSNGCPTTRKVALMGVATDCTYTKSFNSTQSVRQNIINQVNSASHVYETTFNISLGLQNLTISDGNCPGTAPAATPWNKDCSKDVTITDRLNDFSKWRGQRQDNNAFWTLLTNCPTGAEVGLAWLGQLCQTTAQTSSNEVSTGANVVAKTSTEWQVIAHETGHTFGAVHDCDQQTCGDGNTVNAQQCCPLSSSTCDANDQFIMSPSSTDGITKFSACTVGNICSAMGRNSVKTQCLSDNKGVTVISGHECGNGIVEDGEECDCGGTEGCGDNQCCDPTTCKFKTGAVCDDANEDCCRGCQLASNGTVCRPGTSICDPQEVCSGSSGTCPPDKTADDGMDCGNNLKCASGQCTSRDFQCKTLMGSMSPKNDTYACDNSDCMLSCASPDFGPNTCYSMQQNFLDGTPCGGSGKCSNGQCQGDSVGGEITSWVSNNKTLVIGLASGIGGIILLCILSCIVSRVRRSRRPPIKNNPMQSIPPGWGSGGAYQNGYRETYGRSRGTGQSQAGYGQGYGQGGGGYWSGPVPTAQPYGYGQSVRYA